MTNILVEISAGELLDKISILELKLRFFTNTSQTENVQQELLILQEAYLLNINPTRELVKNFNLLRDVNHDLWQLENKIRLLIINEDYSKCFIDTTKSIHDKNDMRAKIKKNINGLTNSTIIEEKDYFT